MSSNTITLWNTGLPLLIAGGMAWVLPRFIAPSQTRSHRKVAVAVGVSALLLVFISAGLFAALQPDKFAMAANTGGLFLAIEIAVRGSILFAVAWMPILLLNWLNLAQRVEHWRGKDMARGGP